MNNLNWDIIMQDNISKIFLIGLSVIFGIAVGVLYHKIFIVFYTDLGRQLLTEIVVSFVVGACIAALTLVFWWITAIIIAIIGLILVLKAQSKAGRIAVLILFIIFEVALIILGVRINSFKKGNQKSNTSTNTYSYQVQNPTTPVVSSAPVSNPVPETSPSYTTPVSLDNFILGTWRCSGITDQYGVLYTTLSEYVDAQLEIQLGGAVDRTSVEYQQAMSMLTEVEDVLKNMTYEFKEKGTANLSVSVDGGTITTSGSYQIQGDQVTITMDGQTNVMTFDSASDTLRLSQDGMTFVMTKQ